MSAAPNPPPAAPAVSPAPTLPPPIGPNPPRRRFWLLLKLFLVPVAVVSLPAVLVNGFFGPGGGLKPLFNVFGQAGQPKNPPPDAAFAGLRESLDKAARAGLPEGGTNFGARFEDLSLPCSPAEADARQEMLRGLAARCGGTLTDQAADAAGRHLLVELPEENLPRFRREAEAVEPTLPPAAGAGGGRVFLRVTLSAPLPPPSPAP